MTYQFWRIISCGGEGSRLIDYFTGNILHVLFHRICSKNYYFVHANCLPMVRYWQLRPILLRQKKICIDKTNDSRLLLAVNITSNGIGTVKCYPVLDTIWHVPHTDSEAQDLLVNQRDLIWELHCPLISECNPNLQNNQQGSSRSDCMDAQTDLELHSSRHLAYFWKD